MGITDEHQVSSQYSHAKLLWLKLAAFVKNHGVRQLAEADLVKKESSWWKLYDIDDIPNVDLEDNAQGFSYMMELLSDIQPNRTFDDRCFEDELDLETSLHRR